MNTEQEIYAYLKKSLAMREIYHRYPKLADEELLKELKAQWEIEEKIQETPILREALLGYGKFLNLKPSEILEKIEYKSDIDIRMDYEEAKRENNINSGKKDFGTDNGSYFKSGIPDTDTGTDFSVSPNDLNF